MKRLWTDFNGQGKYLFIPTDEADFFKLELDEKIAFYDEDFQLEAIVKQTTRRDFFELIGYNRETTLDLNEIIWYGEIVSDVKRYSEEVEIALRDGFKNGNHFGNWTTKQKIAFKMKDKGYDLDEVFEITGYRIQPNNSKK